MSEQSHPNWVVVDLRESYLNWIISRSTSILLQLNH